MKNMTKQTLKRSGHGGLVLNALLAALPAWRPGNTRPETPHPSKFVKAVVYSAKRCYRSRLLGNIVNVGCAQTPHLQYYNRPCGVLDLAANDPCLNR